MIWKICYRSSTSNTCTLAYSHTLPFCTCHVIAISMSLTNESVSGDDKIESTWEWCGEVTSRLCVEPRMESAIQLLMSICEWLLWWWWWRWFCMLFDTWFDWFCGFDDDSNGSQCWISIFGSPLRPQFPFIPLWLMLFNIIFLGNNQFFSVIYRSLVYTEGKRSKGTFCTTKS